MCDADFRSICKRVLAFLSQNTFFESVGKSFSVKSRGQTLPRSFGSSRNQAAYTDPDELTWSPNTHIVESIVQRWHGGGWWHVWNWSGKEGGRKETGRRFNPVLTSSVCVSRFGNDTRDFAPEKVTRVS